MASLPKVASNFFTECKKCEQDRYHKVLTHLTSASAKLECEVCHSKKTYKLNEGKVTVAKAKKASTRKPKAQVALEAQNTRYRELSEKVGESKVQPYRMTNIYTIDTKIEHPKFGVGFVVASLPDKIEVVFEDSARHLVQGRK